MVSAEVRAVMNGSQREWPMECVVRSGQAAVRITFHPKTGIEKNWQQNYMCHSQYKRTVWDY